MSPKYTMRIRKISVTRLFGIFNHSISLNLDGRVTIILGPNGFGKTIILRMVDRLFHGDYSIFRNVPFSRLSIEFIDKSILQVIKTKPSISETKKKAAFPQLEIILSTPGKKREVTFNPISVVPSSGSKRDLIMHFLDRVEEEIPFLVRVDYDVWRDSRTGEYISMDKVLESYSDHLSLPSKLIPRTKEPKPLSDLRKSFPVRLIQTQRLDVAPGEFLRHKSRRERQANIPTVKKYSDEIVRNMGAVLKQYSVKSQELDRTFPSRLVMRDPSTVLLSNDLRDKLTSLEEKRVKLTNLGFIDPEQHLSPGVTFDAVKGKEDVLSVYVDDAEQKLGVFDEIASKIDLFLSIVNQRFLYKEMSISREKGFVFTSSTGSELSAIDLSSGEQHELVLLFEMLFKIEQNSLVLIDEPEISLHVEWQERFLEDLLKVVKLSNFDVIIATHSPEIIGGIWDLCVNLKGPNDSTSDAIAKS